MNSLLYIFRMEFFSINPDQLSPYVYLLEVIIRNCFLILREIQFVKKDCINQLVSFEKCSVLVPVPRAIIV